MTWKELDIEFQELSIPRNPIRLNIQWGSSGEHFHVSDRSNRKNRFEVLSRIAGNKLRLQLIANTEDNSFVLAEKNSVLLWYKALWKFSPNFNLGICGEETSKEGVHLGMIFTGDVSSAEEASATLSLHFSSTLGEPRKDSRISKKALFEIKPAFWGLSINLIELFRRIRKK